MKQNQLESLKLMAQRESDPALHRLRTQPVWEKKNLSLEEYIGDAAETLQNANKHVRGEITKAPDYLEVLDSLQKVIVASAHFIREQELDKLKGVASLLAHQGLTHGELQQLNITRKSRLSDSES
jgi:hypothetical protein